MIGRTLGPYRIVDKIGEHWYSIARDHFPGQFEKGRRQCVDQPS